VARALSGAATANIGTASAYIADITTPEERVKGMGMIGLAFGLGFLIGPGVGGPLAAFTVNGRHGPVACYVAAGLSVINFVWALFGLPESLPAHKRATGPKRALSPLRIDPLRRLLSTRGIGAASLTNFLIILAFSGLEITYAMYASDRFELSHQQVGYFFVYMGLIGAAVQGGFVRRASGRVRETTLATAGLVLQLMGFLVFVVAPRFGLPGLLLASALIAIGNGCTQPAISAYISRLADPTRQGETLSANQSVSALARVFGPLLGGYLYTFGTHWPFVCCALCNALALLVTSSMRDVQPQTLRVSNASSR
jgi:MFS transporter, DHA1 family, tetracycline resistance protein